MGALGEGTAEESHSELGEGKEGGCAETTKPHAESPTGTARRKKENRAWSFFIAQHK